MIEITSWTQAFAQKLCSHFGPRLLFVGYQGSYARGEATPESDIDIVTILDQVAPADLDGYRELVRSMLFDPEFCVQNSATCPQDNVEACGFICGEHELRSWPRYDLLSVALDTKPVLGRLEPFLPEFTDADRREALAIGAANLYHGACHTYLYGDRAAALPGLLKAAFFCLRLRVLCREGRYCATKHELAEVLNGQELELLELTRNAPRSPGPVDRAYSLLIDWTSQLIRQS